MLELQYILHNPHVYVRQEFHRYYITNDTPDSRIHMFHNISLDLLQLLDLLQEYYQ